MLESQFKIQEQMNERLLNSRNSLYKVTEAPTSMVEKGSGENQTSSKVQFVEDFTKTNLRDGKIKCIK